MTLSFPEGAWIIEDVIAVGGLGVLYGASKDGKSFLALSLAEAVANPFRSHFLGLPITRHGPVAFLQLDTPRSSWINRLKKMCAADPSLDFSNVYFADKDMEDIPFPFNILADGPELKKKLEAVKPVLAISDTFRDLHPADENDSSAMRNVLSAMIAALPNQTAHVMIAHRRKEFQFDDDDLVNSIRGSSAIVGKMDIIFGLKRFKNSTRGILRYQGRDTELVTLNLEFDRDRLVWDLDAEEQKLLRHFQGVINEFPGDSKREWGRQLVLRSDHWKDCKDPADAAYQWVKRKTGTFIVPKIVAGPITTP